MRWTLALTVVAVLLSPVSAITVNVAMWAGKGAASNCVESSLRAVDYWNTNCGGIYHINVITYVSPSDWRAVLETGRDPYTGTRIDVIYVPGGYHPEWHWDPDWIDLLYHAQIDLGIGYVGVCAGAYLHAGVTHRKAIGEDLVVDGVTAIDGNRGNGYVPVLILQNPITPRSTWGKIYEYYYANGPGMAAEDGSVFVSDNRWYKVCWLNGKEVRIDVQGFGKYVGLVNGWAMVLGWYSVRSGDKWEPRGRFVLLGVHPELTERTGAWKLLARALIWAAGYEPRESPTKKQGSSEGTPIVPVPPVRLPRSRRACGRSPLTTPSCRGT
ncbi:hypothetical protein [Methanopyrus sp.]